MADAVGVLVAAALEQGVPRSACSMPSSAPLVLPSAPLRSSVEASFAECQTVCGSWSLAVTPLGALFAELLHFLHFTALELC